ncbi:MAG: hypothetical protein EOO43_00780 [Flavobacterium sp.]|nr:MAG: hypothetical protein EOO43_00780 [Flavobacterium sp.]
MVNKIKSLGRSLGIDGAIIFTILSRVVQAGGGMITLIFVANFLTKIEQGYYYTFGSILAIQIFFELGLSNIITQFVAHEVANLKWIDDTSFECDLKSSSRLSSLLRFTLKWFVIVAFFLTFGLIVTGYLFFNNYGLGNSNVHWQAAWVILAIVTSLNLIASPVLAFLEGLGMVKKIAKIRMIQQLVQLSISLMLFYFNFKLLSTPLATIAGFLIIPCWIIFSNRRKLLVFIWEQKNIFTVDYYKEIFPFQWKIALSWISGYFIFQLFNPVLFATEGPVVAGQMGMTIAVLNAVLMFTLSWITTKVPSFSTLIAQRNFSALDELFNNALVQSSVLNVLALLIIFTTIFLFRYFNITLNGKNFGDRFLPYIPLLFMMVPIICNHIISGWATYLRCHKREPMLFQSIVIGVLCCLSTILLGRKYGVLGMTSGYMVIIVISLFWTYMIFENCKRKWHNE